MKIKKLLFYVLPLSLALLIFLSACQNGEEVKNTVTSSALSGDSAAFDKSSLTETSSALSGSTKSESSTSSALSPTSNSDKTSSKKPFEPTEYKAETAKSVKAAISSKLELLSLGSSNGIMCAEIKNVSDTDIEYCRLVAFSKGNTAEFLLSVLPKGETAVVFEKDEKKFDESFFNAAWGAEDEIDFEQPLETMESVFEVNCSDGMLEIKNKTSSDIDKTIIICYKSVISGKLSGSVSFRMKLDKMKSGETKQLFSDNVGENSRVMYIKYGS